MPKHFPDERTLLFPVTRIQPSELSVEALITLFSNQNERTICLTFKGFADSSLGFVANVRKTKDGFEFLNITRQVELIAQNESQLVEILKHVSGVEYSVRAQKAFQQVRNDIGGRVSLRTLPEEL